MEWKVDVNYVDKAFQGDEVHSLRMTSSCLLTVMKHRIWRNHYSKLCVIQFLLSFMLFYTLLFQLHYFSLLALTGLCTMMSVVFLPALSFFSDCSSLCLLPSSQPPFLFFGSHWGGFSLLFYIKYQKREHWEQERYSLSTVFFFLRVSPRLLRVQCSLCIEISLEDQP